MKLTIFNQNTWLVPFPFSKHGRTRTRDLISIIRELHPDVVTLQEVILRRDMLRLKKALPEYFFTCPNGRFANRSGLLTLTKEKPKMMKFLALPFVRKTNLDMFTKRSVLFVRLGSFTIFNTHLSPWDTPLAKKQFEFIKRLCRKEKIAIVAGDLNIEYGSFDSANNGFFECIDSIGHTFSLYNKYVKKWWEINVITDKKIDYILVRHPPGKEILFKSKIIMKPIVSDHYGLFSEIEIR